MVKTLVILRGLPGSGKSTIAKDAIPSEFSSPTDSQVSVSLDHWFTTPEGVYLYDAQVVTAGVENMKRELLRVMRDFNTPCVFLDNTNIRHWEYTWAYPMAARCGYRVQVVSLYDAGLSDSELAARNRHGVSEFRIAQMRARWED